MSMWTNRTAGVAARNGLNTHTITFSTFGDAPFTPTDGRLLVVLVAGPVTTSWPDGWNERLTPVNNSELSVATIEADGTTSVTVTHNGANYPVEVVVYEFEEGSSWVAGAGAINQPNGSGSPTLSGLPGTPVSVFYALSWAPSPDTTTRTTTWTGATEDYDHLAPLGVTDGAYLSAAYNDAVTGTSSSAAANVVSDHLDGGMEMVAFAVDAAAPPAVPVVDAGPDITVTIGDLVSRTATASGSPTSWAWTVSSGPAQVGDTIGTAAALAWTPEEAGVYTVSVTATNGVGESDPDTLTVTVNSPPPPPQVRGSARWLRGFFAAG